MAGDPKVGNGSSQNIETIKKRLGEINEKQTLTKEEWDAVVDILRDVSAKEQLRNFASLFVRDRIVKPAVSHFLRTHRISGTLYEANYSVEANYKSDLIQAGWAAGYSAAFKYKKDHESNASFYTYAYMEVQNAIQQLFYRTVSPVDVHYVCVDEVKKKYLPDRRVQTEYLSSFVKAKNQETDTELEELIGVEAVDYILEALNFQGNKLFFDSFFSFIKAGNKNKELLNAVMMIVSKKKQHRVVDLEELFSISRQRFDFLFRKALKKWKASISKSKKYKNVVIMMDEIAKKAIAKKTEETGSTSGQKRGGKK